MVLSKPGSEYSGSAPDLGFAEFLATASVPSGPGKIGLSEARPNPFTHETHFVLGLGEAAFAELGVFDLSGRRVAKLFEGRLDAGQHPFRWDGTRSDGSRAAGGVYFYRVRTPCGDGDPEARAVWRGVKRRADPGLRRRVLRRPCLESAPRPDCFDYAARAFC